MRLGMKLHESGTNGGDVPRPRRRVKGGLRAILAGLLLVGLVVPASTAIAPEWTEATWSDAEHATGTLAAITVPAPIATAQCLAQPGLLGLAPSVTIYWRVPTGYPGYTAADAELRDGGDTLLGTIGQLLLGKKIENTGTPAAYVTKIDTGILGGLLSGKWTYKIRLTKGDWYSSDLTVVATVPALGLGSPTCTVTPPLA